MTVQVVILPTLMELEEKVFMELSLKMKTLRLVMEVLELYPWQMQVSSRRICRL